MVISDLQDLVSLAEECFGKKTLESIQLRADVFDRIIEEMPNDMQKKLVDYPNGFMSMELCGITVFRGSRPKGYTNPFQDGK